MVDEVDRPGPLEQLLELAVGADVGADDLLVGLVLQVAAPDVVAAAAQLRDERASERALRAGDEDLRHFESMRRAATRQSSLVMPFLP